MLRILRNASATIFQSFYVDEEEVTATGTVTVIVAGPDGVTTSSGNATYNGDTYTYAFPPRAELGFYTVKFTGTVNGITQSVVAFVEVVGNRLFTIAEARASDTRFADVNLFPTAVIELRRQEIENEFEKITGVSFIPRGKYLTAATIPDVYDLPLITVVEHSEYLSGYDPDYDNAPYDSWVRYEYGFVYPPPEVKREALVRLRSLLNQNKSSIPDRATSMVTENGTFTMATAGMRGSETGIPSVDAVLKRYVRIQAVIF